MPPTGRLSGEEKAWALIAHFGGAAAGFFTGALLGWIAPLISMLSYGPKSAAVRAQSVDALNFQVLWAVVAAVVYLAGGCVGIFTFGIGFVGYVLVLVALVMEVVFGIVAGIKASNDEPYHYPGSPSWIK